MNVVMAPQKDRKRTQVNVDSVLSYCGPLYQSNEVGLWTVGMKRLTVDLMSSESYTQFYKITLEPHVLN